MWYIIKTGDFPISSVKKKSRQSTMLIICGHFHLKTRPCKSIACSWYAAACEVAVQVTMKSGWNTRFLGWTSPTWRMPRCCLGVPENWEPEPVTENHPLGCPYSALVFQNMQGSYMFIMSTCICVASLRLLKWWNGVVTWALARASIMAAVSITCKKLGICHTIRLWTCPVFKRSSDC